MGTKQTGAQKIAAIWRDYQRTMRGFNAAIVVGDYEKASRIAREAADHRDMAIAAVASGAAQS